MSVPLKSPDTPSPSVRPEFSAQDYARGLERLVLAVQELSLARSLAEVQRIVRTAAREITDCDGATFVLRDEGHCYYADEDAISPLWKGKRFPMEVCISGWAMLNRDSAVIPDIYRDARIPHAAYRPTFVRSLAMVPIRKLEPIGAIGNYWSCKHQPSDREVSLLQALADATSVAMENVQVYSELEERVRDRTAELTKANEEIRQLAITDELTGLSNRRGFYLMADAALETVRRQRSRCLLAFIDVDGLKKVNDQNGHDAGDALISDVAHILRATLRRSDVIGRMGGDEFCILVTDPDGDLTLMRARLQQAIHAFNETHQRPYRVSASIGLIERSLNHDDGITLDDLLTDADELMYEEKKTRDGSPLTS